MEIALWLLGGLVLLVLLNRLVILAFWRDPDELELISVEIREEVTYQASGIVPGVVSWVAPLPSKTKVTQGDSDED